MGLSIADQYYVKAFDNYPFEIENTVENLSYALSYDEHHVQANCLMGQVPVSYTHLTLPTNREV